MIPVSNSRIIEFINWLKVSKHQEYLANMDYDSLYKLAKLFLEDRTLIPPKRSEGLKFILVLYQSFPLKTTEPVKRMEQFCQYYNYGKYNKDWFIKTHTPLHTFLKRFITFANSVGYKSWFENLLFDFLEQERETTFDRITSFMEMYGRSLRKIFTQYCNQVHPSSLGNFREFLRGNQITKDDNIDNQRYQAEGLTQAIRELIHGEHYDEIIARNEATSEFLCLTLGLSVDLVQGITFIEWLNKRHPSVNLLGNIPSKKIDQWSKEFCSSKGYSNATEFTRDIKRLLNSKNSVSQFSNRLMRYIRKRSPYLETRDDLISRYDTVLMHGMFIFAPIHNLSAFIESNWKQFNYILGQSIDVYYSIEDLEGRTDQSIDQYEYLNVNLNDLPAFIFWDKTLEEHTLVSFNGLVEHTDIAEVFEKIIIAGIRNNESAKRIKSNAEEWKLHRIAERKLEAVMKNGGFSMNVFKGQNFVNYGNKMEVKGNIIKQTDGASDFKVFEEKDISALRGILQALKNSNHEDLSEDLALQGASIISGLIKASQEKNEESQADKLRELHSWNQLIGEKGLKALAIIADLTTLSIPVLHLLGYTNF